MNKSNRGGLRNPPGGRPALSPEEKREKHSPTLAPGTKELAQAIAKKCGYPGWGYAIDEAIKNMALNLDIPVKIYCVSCGKPLAFGVYDAPVVCNEICGEEFRNGYS